MISHTERSWRGMRSYRQGWWMEILASWILYLKGYHIEKRRYRTPAGEIDLVASRGKMLIIVEVKKRRTRALAKESLLISQRKRLRRAGHWTLGHMSQKKKIRFDGIFFAPWTWPLHLKNILCED